MVKLTVVQPVEGMDIWCVRLGEVKEPIGTILEYEGRVFLNPSRENSLWSIELLLAVTECMIVLQDELEYKLKNNKEISRDAH